MGFKIKNSLTGEFEKLPILTLKGEKGETGGVEEYNKVDYMGNKYETLKQANDANVEYAVKTAIGEFNYLDYDGQHITATDTIEGRSKSAILSGNTFLNLATPVEYKTINFHGYCLIINGNKLKSGTYTIKSSVDFSKYVLDLMSTQKDKPHFYARIQITKNGVFTINDTFFIANGGKAEDFFFCLRPVNDAVGGVVNTNEIENVRLVLLEGDHTNEDIPYFTGMQSVKMPVLTTTGKNLFDENRRYEVSHKLWFAIPFEKDSYFTFSSFDTIPYIEFYGTTTEFIDKLYGGNGVSWKPLATFSNKESGTFKKESKYNYIIIAFDKAKLSNGEDFLKNLQVEQGTQATTYEPFKSNILTVNEEVELRGIGDVKDTLDCLTGEVIERIGEIVLDDTLSYEHAWGGGRDTETDYVIGVKVNNHLWNVHNEEGGSLIKCDKLRTRGITSFNGYGYFLFYVSKSILGEELTNAKIREYILSLNATVQYPLATPIVKTVDLSDNHVYSYKGTTHYDCSSAEGSLVPTLSVKVPTDVQATIAQQRETIQTLNSENERLNQIQEALKASMLDSQVQLMNLSWDTDFEVFTLRESIAPKDSLMDSRTGSNIDKFSQAKFIIENDCPDLEKLNSQIEYYFSKDVFSQEQFEELTYLISIVKGENSCEY